jgi:parallel beta-helix repeat protein
MRVNRVFVLVVLLNSISVAVGSGAQSTDATAQTAPLTLTGPVRITTNTRIAPGIYRVAVPAGKAAIEIEGDNVDLDLTGVTLTSGIDRPWEREGIGVRSTGHNHITIRGGAIHGYRFGILLQGGYGADGLQDDLRGSDNVRIIGTDLSENRAQQLQSTDTRYDKRDFLDIFRLDSWESYGAGLYLKDIHGAWLENVVAHNGQNGALLVNTTHSTLYRCDFSHNSGWGIALYRSSRNDLLENHADWVNRCVTKTNRGGCDSAGILLMDGSSFNRVIGNTFTHSGDGYFASKSTTGDSCDYNYVAFNDGSYSPGNAFESNFNRGNQFYHNTAGRSGYGFWLGFARGTLVIDNHIEGNQHDGIAIEHGSANILIRNEILRSDEVGIRLWRRQSRPDPSRDYVVLENRIVGSKIGIALDQTFDATITDNTLIDNELAIKVGKGNVRVKLQANEFSPAGARMVEAEEQGAVEE